MDKYQDWVKWGSGNLYPIVVPDTIELLTKKSLEEKTGLHVSILNKKDNSGKIYFEYKDLEQLNFITKLIKSDN